MPLRKDRARRVVGLRVDSVCEACGKVKRVRPCHVSRFCSYACSLTRLRSSIRAKACHGCGITSVMRVPNHSLGAYCSQKCWHATRTKVAAEVAVLFRMATRNKPKPCRRTAELVRAEVQALRFIASYVERPRTFRALCGCGLEFIARRPRPSAKCPGCLRETARRHKRKDKARRKAAARGVHAERFDPIAVFERDGWHCRICGVATPAELRGSYQAQAPELDHIHPISKGGKHTMDNVQCACRRCNADKSDSLNYAGKRAA